MNTPLRPEVRVNKNGVPVVKHVRSDQQAAAPRAAIPAPGAASPPKPVKPPKGFSVKKVWSINKSVVRASWEIVYKVKGAVPPIMNYHFEATDAEAYDVMLVVAPKNLMPLMATGLRTKDETVAYLKSNGLDEHIVDNSALVREATRRGISAQKIMLLGNDFPTVTMETNEFYFDAAEINSIKALQEVERNRGVTDRVLQGKIRASDIKAVGAVRVASAGGNSLVLEQLERIKEGDESIPADQLAQLISKANPRMLQSDPYTVNQVVRAARLYGTDTILKLDNLSVLTRKAQELSAANDDHAEVGGMLVWVDRIWQLNHSYPDTEDIIALYRADVAPEKAAEDFNAGMTAQQIIAVTQEGIKPAMSSGWL